MLRGRWHMRWPSRRRCGLADVRQSTSLRIRRILDPARMPSSFGIEQSIRIASKLVWQAAATASSPSPTTSTWQPNCRRVSSRSPRTRSLSSAIRMRMAGPASVERFGFVSAQIRLFACRGDRGRWFGGDGEAEMSAMRMSFADLDGAAESFDKLATDRQPEVPTRPNWHRDRIPGRCARDHPSQCLNQCPRRRRRECQVRRC